MVKSYYARIGKIGGPATIVEIDESKFGKRKFNKGRKVDGVWVLGMVERTTERRIILTTIAQRTKKNLLYSQLFIVFFVGRFIYSIGH